MALRPSVPPPTSSPPKHCLGMAWACYGHIWASSGHGRGMGQIYRHGSRHMAAHEFITISQMSLCAALRKTEHVGICANAPAWAHVTAPGVRYIAARAFSMCKISWCTRNTARGALHSVDTLVAVSQAFGVTETTLRNTHTLNPTAQPSSNTQRVRDTHRRAWNGQQLFTFSTSQPGIVAKACGLQSFANDQRHVL